MPFDKNADNIQVMVRIRPLNSREIQEEVCLKVDTFQQNKIIVDGKPEKIFNFDWVGGETTTQQQVFDFVGKPMVQACLEGYNCCVFAYGQTGAGKTFTMQGRGLDANDKKDLSDRGLQPRIFDYIFSVMAQEVKEDPAREFLVTCSFLEIYNEELKDLLEPVSAGLQIRESLESGIFIQGIKEESVKNSEETIELLRKGARNRHVGSTQMNAESSRSHSVFSMMIESKKSMNGIIKITSSKFHFVDLAGSERQTKTAATGDRLKEAGNINKSLTVLGSVINSLVEVSNGKKPYIRYRDSKLTYFLKDSLGGNSKTCLIANASPAASSLSETLSTLNFAQRAKQIKNNASINQASVGNEDGMKLEIKRLTEELNKAKSIILNLENEQKFIPKSPKLTPQMIGKLSIEKNIREYNQRSLEIEIPLRKCLEIITQNQIALQREINNKELFVQTFKNATTFYEDNENQYKLIIDLCNDRIQRISKSPSEMTDDYDTQFEILELRKINEHMVKIMNNTPVIMKTFMENAELREQLEDSSSQNNQDYCSISKILDETINMLTNLMIKVEESVKERKYITDRLDNIENSKGIPNPITHRKLEEEIKRIKTESNQKIEAMHSDILKIMQSKTEIEKDLENEKKKSQEYFKDLHNMKELNQKNEEAYKTNLENLFQNFEEIQNGKVIVNDLEKKLNEMTIENLKLKQEVNCLNEKQENAVILLQTCESAYKLKLQQTLDALSKIDSESKETKRKNDSLQNMILSLKNQISLLENELKKSREEADELSLKLSESYERENEIKIGLDNIYNEHIELKSTILEQAEAHNAEKSSLENRISLLQDKFEESENQKKLCMDENESLTFAINYKDDLIEEKKNLILDLQSKIFTQKNEYEKVLEELKRLKEIEISNQHKESSAQIEVLKENDKLKQEIIKLESEIKTFSSDNSKLIEQIKMKEMFLNQMSDSISSYSQSYKDIMKKYESEKSLKENLEYALEEKNSELKHDREEFNQLKIENLQLSENNQNLKQIILSKEHDIAYHLSEIAELSKNNKETSDKLDLMEKEMNKLVEENQKLLYYQDECSNLLNEYENINKSQYDKNNELNLKIEQLDREIEELKLTISNKLKDINSKDLLIQNIKKDLEDKMKKIDSQEHLLKEKLVEKEKNENEIAYLKSEIENISNAISQLKENLKEENLKSESLVKRLELKDTKIRENEEIIKQKDDEKSKLMIALTESKFILAKNQELLSHANDKSAIEEESKAVKMDLDKANRALESLQNEFNDSLIFYKTEMIRIKEAYTKLENQYRLLEPIMRVKDEDIIKYKLMIKAKDLDRESAFKEVSKIKVSESKLKKELEDLNQKYEKIKSEKMNLILEVELANNQLSGVSNGEIKQKHITKFKEETSKLRDENSKLRTKIGLINERNDRLQRQLDTFLKKVAPEDSTLSDDCSEISELRTQIIYFKGLNRKLLEGFNKLSKLVSSFFKDNVVIEGGEMDILIEKLHLMIETIESKEQVILEHERDFASRSLHYSLLEKEVSILKTKKNIQNQFDFDNTVDTNKENFAQNINFNMDDTLLSTNSRNFRPKPEKIEDLDIHRESRKMRKQDIKDEIKYESESYYTNNFLENTNRSHHFDVKNESQMDSISKKIKIDE